MKIFVYLLIFAQLSWAQNHTSGGGGGPYLEEELQKICNNALQTAISEEKIFVEAYKKNYNNYKDFFALIELISFQKSLEDIKSLSYDASYLFSKCKCDKNVLLKSILFNYEYSKGLGCPHFEERSRKIELIKKLIE
jgi:hypothetical protein